MLQQGYNVLHTWDSKSGDDSATEKLTLPLGLEDTEIRILGALIEKEVTTPEYYPLSLNALVNACNQKTNRQPVTAYDEAAIAETLGMLRDKHLIGEITGGDNRVPKYRQYLSRRLHLEPPLVATLAVLMLRGPLTSGEIRSCAGSLHPFADLAAVESALTELQNCSQGTLVVQLARRPGQKESRWMHRLGAEPAVAPEMTATEASAATTPPAPRFSERVEALEAEVKSMREELQRLNDDFEAFRRQFE